MDPEERQHIFATMIGSFLILVGYYLPWYSLVFEPPGGYAWLNGLKYGEALCMRWSVRCSLCWGWG